MASSIPSTHADLLQKAGFASLATLNADGSPQVTCVYVGWDGDEIVAGHVADHVKLRNIRRDPRVTLSVESDVPFEGFSPYVVISGMARVEEGGAVELLRRITHGAFPPPGGVIAEPATDGTSITNSSYQMVVRADSTVTEVDYSTTDTNGTSTG